MKLSNKLLRPSRQAEQLEAVLLSMTEGIIVVDVDHRIMIINRAAAGLFAIDSRNSFGKQLSDTIKHPEVLTCIEDTLEKQQPAQANLVISEPIPRFLQLNTAVLRSSSQDCLGAVLVLSDVTHIKRLETIRSDFVANVSHELKTPITSIKGFIETLLDGAMDNREDLERFLTVIQRQSDRLMTIIEDLLMLSRIEQESDRREIDLDDSDLNEIVLTAVHLCQERASQKGIRINFKKREPLIKRVNVRLMEQALVNLIDNSIKYSEPGANIDVEISQNSFGTTISVRDQGCGIAPEHLDRLFERFYRVDKARSRKLGGTGLGLAIVKHIAQAHGGRVTVKSIINQGSTFTLHLP